MRSSRTCGDELEPTAATQRALHASGRIHRMVYEITPVLRGDIGVWPGDTPLTREVLLDMRAGANITLSTLRATVHLGAHADALVRG